MPSATARPHHSSTKKTAKASPSPTQTEWSHKFETLRREDLFRNPPKDHSAYPLLQDAIAPHIDSFNALFEEDNGLIAKALKDIGTKSYLDQDETIPISSRNRLDIKIVQIYVTKPTLPDNNKVSKNRQVLPAECRERHVTYRGRLMAKFQYRVNSGDPSEFIRDLGLLPVMIMVCPFT